MRSARSASCSADGPGVPRWRRRRPAGFGGQRDGICARRARARPWLQHGGARAVALLPHHKAAVEQRGDDAAGDRRPSTCSASRGSSTGRTIAVATATRRAPPSRAGATCPAPRRREPRRQSGRWHVHPRDAEHDTRRRQRARASPRKAPMTAAVGSYPSSASRSPSPASSNAARPGPEVQQQRRPRGGGQRPRHRAVPSAASGGRRRASSAGGVRWRRRGCGTPSSTAPVARGGAEGGRAAPAPPIDAAVACSHGPIAKDVDPAADGERRDAPQRAEQPARASGCAAAAPPSRRRGAARRRAPAPTATPTARRRRRGAGRARRGACRGASITRQMQRRLQKAERDRQVDEQRHAARAVERRELR